MDLMYKKCPVGYGMASAPYIMKGGSRLRTGPWTCEEIVWVSAVVWSSEEEDKANGFIYYVEPPVPVVPEVKTVMEPVTVMVPKVVKVEPQPEPVEPKVEPAPAQVGESVLDKDALPNKEA